MRDTSSASQNRTNITNTSSAVTNQNCINMLDYFRSSANREAGKSKQNIDKENTQSFQ